MKLTTLTNEEAMAEITTAIKTRRKYLGLSQDDLAKASGLGRLSIIKIEQGKPFEVSSLISILRVLKCKITIKP
jgi:DNA-binding XRE family transcriptional regulator